MVNDVGKIRHPSNVWPTEVTDAGTSVTQAPCLTQQRWRMLATSVTQAPCLTQQRWWMSEKSVTQAMFNQQRWRMLATSVTQVQKPTDMTVFKFDQQRWRMLATTVPEACSNETRHPMKKIEDPTGNPSQTLIISQVSHLHWIRPQIQSKWHSWMPTCWYWIHADPRNSLNKPAIWDGSEVRTVTKPIVHLKELPVAILSQFSTLPHSSPLNVHAAP